MLVWKKMKQFKYYGYTELNQRLITKKGKRKKQQILNGKSNDE